MNVSVLTYVNPNNWNLRRDFKRIVGGIHICATKSMTEGIQSRYESFGLKDVFNNQKVMNALFPVVFSSAVRLQLLLESMEALDTSSMDSEEKAIIRKNAKEIIDTSVNLRFIGVHPEDMDGMPLDKSEAIVTIFWKSVISKCQSYKLIERDVLKYSDKISYFRETLAKVLECDANSLIQREIFLDGFYYITPQQQVLLQMLKKSGCKLVFFNLYDNRYPETFEFIRESICSSNGWPDTWEIEDLSGYQEIGNGHVFLNAFVRGGRIHPKKNVPLKRYRSLSHFKYDVLSKNYHYENQDYVRNQGFMVFGTNADILNNILENYYPDHKGALRNFLKYPVGQFITTLHSLYGEDDKISVNFDQLYRIYSSGWIFNQETGENARDFLFRMKQIESHFIGCSDPIQWENRFDNLLDIVANIERYFNMSEMNADRVYQSFKSPFSRFSISELSEVELKKLKEFFGMVIALSKILFSEGKRSNFKEHFGKLTKIILQMSETRKNFHDELERKVVKEVCGALERIDGKFVFLYKDLSTALSYYLSGSLEPEPERLIKPFIEIDGAVMRLDIEHIHITGMDEFGLPFGEFELPWPYRKQTLAVLGKRISPVSLFNSRNQTVKKVSRYLLYIALEFTRSDTEFSWIENFYDKEGLKRSFYTEIAKGLFQEVTSNLHDNTVIKVNSGISEIDDVSVFPVFEDYLAEYAYCPRRFMYSYILNKYSTFNSDFILKNFMFTHLLRVIKYHCGLSEDKTFCDAYRFFPQWNETTMRAMGYKSMKMKLTRDKMSSYKNLSIPLSRQRFIFPGSKNEDINRYYSYDARNEAEASIPEMLKAGRFHRLDKTSCVFCPYMDRCDEYGKKERL